jgi:hypothetical protein
MEVIYYDLYCQPEDDYCDEDEVCTEDDVDCVNDLAVEEGYEYDG